MLQEAKDLQNSVVTRLVNIIGNNKKEWTFKAPTGSGKTYMMADFMNRIVSSDENIIFIVSSLSKSDLAEQNYLSFKHFSEIGIFPKLNPFLITSDSSGEGSLYIPTEGYNVYVIPRDLYKKKSKLKEEGTFVNFLKIMTPSVFTESKGKTIYLIKDECHIATENLDGLNEYFSKIIKFSATPNLARRQNPDVEITNIEAEAAHLIKRIELGGEDETVDDALNKFEEIKKTYRNELRVNPCLIIQISNKEKAEEELANKIKPALANHQDLKWVYITGDNKTCQTNDDGLRKLPVTKWKDYMKQRSSTISVIIFKMVISEGWDIPRACMLYQIRDSNSEQLNEQVMGRVRRNPRLLDFETLSEKAQQLAMTAWIWGVVPKDAVSTRSVNLFRDYNIENNLRITPTKLIGISPDKIFNVETYINNLEDKNITHPSIFDMYRSILKQNNEIQSACYQYADTYQKWRVFVENLSKIKLKYEKDICDYEKSMKVCDEVSFPADSSYNESEKTLTLDDWIWCRKDNMTDFSFDSEAERKWAEVLKDIRKSSIGETEKVGSHLDFDETRKFLWGKNFPLNSEISFEYYLDGIHRSYPDFVMKDKKGQIHIFEVKSVNKSYGILFDEEEYKEKVRAIKNCYITCSKKTGYVFYLPILDGSDWHITKFESGEEYTITHEQFKKQFY